MYLRQLCCLRGNTESAGPDAPMYVKLLNNQLGANGMSQVLVGDVAERDARSC